MTISEQQSTKSTRSGRFAMLTGALAVLGCVLACSLPLLAAGGALAGVSALAAGWLPAAALALVVAAGTTVLYLQRRQAARKGVNDARCGCSGSC